MCIFVAALITRTLFALTLQDGYYFADSVAYSAAAMDLITDGDFSKFYDRSPIYPLFLAGIYALLGEQIIVVRLVEALLGACLAAVIALLARRMCGDKVGALAGMRWSLYPMGVFIVGLVYPTNLATLLLACAMLCIVPKTESAFMPGRLVGGGVLLGLTVITVPIALLTLLVITLWIIFWHRTHRFRLAALMLVAAALPLMLWTVRNFYVHERLVLIEPRLLTLIPWPLEPPPPEEAQKDEQLLGAEKIDVMLANPGALARRFLEHFPLFWELYPTRVLMMSPSFREQMHTEDSRILKETGFTGSWTNWVSVLSVGPMFFFAVIGVGAMCVHKGQWSNLSLLCGVILSFAIGYSFFWGKLRYRIPVEPYILILSAYGLWQVGRVLARLTSQWHAAGAPPSLTIPGAVGQGSSHPGDVSGKQGS